MLYFKRILHSPNINTLNIRVSLYSEYGWKPTGEVFKTLHSLDTQYCQAIELTVEATWDQLCRAERSLPYPIAHLNYPNPYGIEYDVWIEAIDAFTAHPTNSLNRAGVNTVLDLLLTPKRDLDYMEGCGKGAKDQVHDFYKHCTTPQEPPRIDNP